MHGFELPGFEIRDYPGETIMVFEFPGKKVFWLRFSEQKSAQTLHPES